MADEECITPVAQAERVLWGFVAEAQTYCELASRADLDILATGLLSRLCEAVEVFTTEVHRVRLST